MEGTPKRLKTDIVQKWFPYAKSEEEGISILEALAKNDNGRLLAKILYKLPEADINELCVVSKVIHGVCKKFNLKSRFYTESLYTFGEGTGGMLGDGQRNTHYVTTPQKINDFYKIGMVSCGRYHTAIVTTDGDLYTFGVQSLSSFKLPNVKIVMVSCGDYHTGIVTKDGDLYTFGYGTHGKLGNGRVDFDKVEFPQKINGLLKIVMVSCGRNHTAFITTDGDLYTFGEGEYGRLGDGETEEHSIGKPQKINGIPKIATVSCGFLHTAIITTDGDLYTFGYGQHGRLGDGEIYNHVVATPQKINKIPRIAMVSCGFYHTGIVTIDGDLYMFGEGRDGKLGNGRTITHYIDTPQKINGLPKVAMVSCGQNHTAIVTTDGDLYTFGDGTNGRLGNGRIDKHFIGAPQKISGIPKVAMVSCGVTHTGFVTQSEDQMGFDKILLPCNACLSNSADYFTMEGAVYCNACAH